MRTVLLVITGILVRPNGFGRNEISLRRVENSETIETIEAHRREEVTTSMLRKKPNRANLHHIALVVP
jgi:hypothetical protein